MFIQNLGLGGMSLFSIVPDYTAEQIPSYIYFILYTCTHAKRAMLGAKRRGS